MHNASLNSIISTVLKICLLCVLFVPLYNCGNSPSGEEHSNRSESDEIEGDDLIDNSEQEDKKYIESNEIPNLPTNVLNAFTNIASEPSTDGSITKVSPTQNNEKRAYIFLCQSFMEEKTQNSIEPSNVCCIENDIYISNSTMHDLEEEKKEDNLDISSNIDIKAKYEEIKLKRKKIKKQYRSNYRNEIFYEDSEYINIDRYLKRSDEMKCRLNKLKLRQQKLKILLQEESSESSTNEEDLFSQAELENNKEIALCMYEIAKNGCQNIVPGLQYLDILKSITDKKTVSDANNKNSKKSKSKSKQRKSKRNKSKKIQHVNKKRNNNLDIEKIVDILTVAKDVTNVLRNNKKIAHDLIDTIKIIQNNNNNNNNSSD